jgi:hypothetical protein
MIQIIIVAGVCYIGLATAIIIAGLIARRRHGRGDKR